MLPFPAIVKDALAKAKPSTRKRKVYHPATGLRLPDGSLVEGGALRVEVQDVEIELELSDFDEGRGLYDWFREFMGTTNANRIGTYNPGELSLDCLDVSRFGTGIQSARLTFVYSETAWFGKMARGGILEAKDW